MIGYAFQMLVIVTAWRLVVPRSDLAKNAWHLFISLWYKFIRFFKLSATSSISR